MAQSLATALFDAALQAVEADDASPEEKAEPGAASECGEMIRVRGLVQVESWAGATRAFGALKRAGLRRGWRGMRVGSARGRDAGILVVDEDTSSAQALVTLLLEEGYKAEVATSAAATWQSQGIPASSPVGRRIGLHTSRTMSRRRGGARSKR